MVPSVDTEKSPATPLGIDPVTLRVAAQCLNNYATPAPPIYMYFINLKKVLESSVMGETVPLKTVKLRLSERETYTGGAER